MGAVLVRRAAWRRLGGWMGRLQWKLTLSYTMVTVVVMLLLLVLSLTTLVGGTAGRQVPAPPLREAAFGLAAEARPYFGTEPPDQGGLQILLRRVVDGNEVRIRQTYVAGEFNEPVPPGEVARLLRGGGARDLFFAFRSPPLLVVVDRDGTTLATTATATAPAGASLLGLLTARKADLVRAALDGDTVFWVGVGAESEELAATPVLDADGRVVGAVYLAHTGPGPLEEFLQSLGIVLVANALPILAVAAIVGSLLGLPTARWLSGRLRRLSAATRAWGAGDFSVMVADRSPDEIGQLARELNRMASQVQALLHDREQLAALEERNRLARDLHDSVTQALYSVTLHAEAAARRLTVGEAALATEHLRDLRTMAHDALREMRLLIFELRPPVLEQEGLVAALQARLESVEGRAGLATALQAEEEERLPPAVEEGLYRLAREALNNVLKHAQARQVAVSLRRANGTVVLEVRDDGVGFDPAAAGGGLGLGGMRERAAQLGGRLSIDSQPGAGTRVRVEVAV